MAVPLKRAPRAGVVVRLRPNFARFRRQLRRTGASLRDAGHALRKLGDSGVTSAAVVSVLHRAIERSAERERVACRIASTSLLTVSARWAELNRPAHPTLDIGVDQ